METQGITFLNFSNSFLKWIYSKLSENEVKSHEFLCDKEQPITKTKKNEEKQSVENQNSSKGMEIIDDKTRLP